MSSYVNANDIILILNVGCDTSKTAITRRRRCPSSNYATKFLVVHTVAAVTNAWRCVPNKKIHAAFHCRAISFNVTRVWNFLRLQNLNSNACKAQQKGELGMILVVSTSDLGVTGCL